MSAQWKDIFFCQLHRECETGDFTTAINCPILFTMYYQESWLCQISVDFTKKIKM